MSEEGKKYAANLAKLLKERQDAIDLLRRANKAMDRAIMFHDVGYIDDIQDDVDRFLTLAEPV